MDRYWCSRAQLAFTPQDKDERSTEIESHFSLVQHCLVDVELFALGRAVNPKFLNTIFITGGRHKLVNRDISEIVSWNIDPPLAELMGSCSFRYDFERGWYCRGDRRHVSPTTCSCVDNKICGIFSTQHGVTFVY